MKHKRTANIILFTYIFTLVSLLTYSQENSVKDENTDIKVQKQISCANLYFNVNQSDIDMSTVRNASALENMRNTIATLLTDTNIEVDSIVLSAMASPDGSLTSNTFLAQKRVNTFKDYLLNEFPNINNAPILIKTSYKVERWSSLTSYVEADPDTPSRSEVLAILNSNIANDEKGRRLKKLQSGEPYAYIVKHILKELRVGNYCIIWYKEKVEPTLASQPELVVEPETILSPISVTDAVPVIINETPAQKKWNVKTNLALWAATVANAGIEYPIKEKFSIDLPLLYSPYMFSRKYRIEVLGIQPEFRYWPGKQMEGHFLGVHAHVAWYTVSMDSKNRYQDKDGDTPLWGGGLSYGYVHHLSDRWGLEFTLGAGYARLVYDTFHNYHNGAKFDTNTKNYWGITRIGINLVYKINLK